MLLKYEKLVNMLRKYVRKSTSQDEMMNVRTNKLTSQVDIRVRLKDNIEMYSFGNIAQLSNEYKTIYP